MLHFRFITLLVVFLLATLHGSEIQEKIDVKEHICEPVVNIQSSQSQKAMIPHRLFQTWKTHDLPFNFATWSATWKKYNPTWEFEIWDDLENRAFIQEFYPWFLPHYDFYPKEINRADVIRYFYLYHFGGVYADMDFECFKSIDPLLEEKCVILGRMSHREDPHNIPNAFMASPPKADFWLTVIYCLLHAPKDHHRPEHVTGPVIIKEALEAYQNKKKRLMILDEMKRFMPDSVPIVIQIRPPCELYPFEWFTNQYQKWPCSYASTWWTHSWE